MKTVSLAELEPKLAGNTLKFVCPNCRDHHIVIPVGPGTGYGGQHWNHSGDLSNLTVDPSLASEAGKRCKWHGWIKNGIVEMDLHEINSDS